MDKTEEETLIGLLMRDGSRTGARRVLTQALDRVQEEIPSVDRRTILVVAIDCAAPVVETRVLYDRGMAYQQPIRATNRIQKGIRAILRNARRVKGRVTSATLADALLAAYPSPEPDPSDPKSASRISIRAIYGA